MNTRLHDELVALRETYFSGDLTDEDWALLQVHLAHCDSCRQAFEQQEQFLQREIADKDARR